MPDELSLSDRMLIALVPSSVPAVMLLISLGLALLVGELPDAFEQIAGGALLITYIKELFPKVMEQGDAAVAAMAPKGSKKADITKYKVYGTVITVVGIGLAVVFQDAAEGFPGIASRRRLKEGGEGKKAYTPASTIAYYVGFFVDGIVLAYDEDPIRMDSSLVKKMVMSLVFAIDNFLDGFGLVPVMKEAFGADDWIPFFVAFSVCVIAGGVTTALLLHYVPSPVFHLAWLSCSSTFILVGAIQLMSKGLNTYVMIGIGLVWVVLFLGDMGDEEEEAEPDTSLKSTKQIKFEAMKEKKKAMQGAVLAAFRERMLAPSSQP
jgi:hypothetical protein